MKNTVPERLGAVLGASWGRFGRHGAVPGRLGTFLGRFGAFWKPSWGRFGTVLGHPGTSWGVFGRSSTFDVHWTGPGTQITVKTYAFCKF